MNSEETRVTGVSDGATRIAASAGRGGTTPQAQQEPNGSTPDGLAQPTGKLTPAKAKRLILFAVSLLAWSRFPLLRWPFVREAAWTLLRNAQIRRPVAGVLQFVRSRKWLSTTLTVCSGILALIVAFEQDPVTDGDLSVDGSTIVFDDVKSHDGQMWLENLGGSLASSPNTAVDPAGREETNRSENDGTRDPADTKYSLAANQSRVGSANPFAAALPAYSAPQPRAVRGAWLTGVIEAIPDGSESGRFAGRELFSPPRR